MITNKKTNKRKSIYPRCDRKRCKNDATLFPILMLPAPKWMKSKMKIELESNLNVCTDHADENKVEDYLDDEGWNQIENMLSIRRLVIPDRNTVYVIFKALEDRKVLE